MLKNKIFILFLLILSMSCNLGFRNELFSREKSIVPVCLMTSAQDIDKIVEPVAIWNKRIGKDIFFIYPNCNDNIKHVPVVFSDDSPEGKECFSEACNVRKTLDKKLISVNVYIWRKSSERVILHELGHLVGCEHTDYLPPCWE